MAALASLDKGIKFMRWVGEIFFRFREFLEVLFEGKEARGIFRSVIWGFRSVIWRLKGR